TVVNLIEKVTLFHKKIETKPLKKKAKTIIKKDFVKAMLDTGIITSRIDWGIASRIGYFKALEFFKGLKIPSSFPTLKDAQNYIDNLEADKISHPDIIRLAKVNDEEGNHILPVIEVEMKIAGEIKR